MAQTSTTSRRHYCKAFDRHKCPANYICKGEICNTSSIGITSNMARCEHSIYHQPGGAFSGRDDCLPAKLMLNLFITGAEQIFLACGVTDFRKQADSLVAIVSMQFKLDPFSDQCVFIFCNRKRNGIKILRYDRNGFILASKKLLDGMKFQWPRTPQEVKEISCQQVEWLFQGLEIEQKKALRPVEMNSKNVCF